MIPQLENVIAVIKTVFESIKKFFEQIVAIIKGEETEGE